MPHPNLDLVYPKPKKVGVCKPIQAAKVKPSTENSNEEKVEDGENLPKKHDENLPERRNSIMRELERFEDSWIKKQLQKIWRLIIHCLAGVLNFVDSILIKVVNRFYYHNI